MEVLGALRERPMTHYETACTLCITPDTADTALWHLVDRGHVRAVREPCGSRSAYRYEVIP